MKTAIVLFLIAISAAFHVSFAEENVTEAEVNENVTDRGFVEGDIVLTRAQQGDLERKLNSKSIDKNRFPQALVADSSYYKWPNGKVYFTMDSTVTSHQRTVDAIWAAIWDFQNQTCIRFQERTSSNADYVRFTKATGCWSYIGRIGGMQEISIGRGCESKGIVIHEILHALGRWHEQSRPDRGDFINVHNENIRSGAEQNFEVVQLNSVITLQGIAYDLGSIMHYRAYSFSKNGQPTITPRDSTISLSSFGQRQGFSSKDLQHVKTLYDCEEQSGSWSQWGSWSSCSRTCNGGTRSRTRTCVGGSSCPGSNIQTEVCSAQSCPVQPTWSSWSAWSTCTQSCGTGRQSRTRTCQNGNTCSGSSTEFRDCNTVACPQPPTWSSWSSWGACSTTCRGGSRSRNRRCINGDTCSGPDVQVESCNDNVPCQPDPSSGEWGQWSSCSASCGGGTRTRSRLCGLQDSSQCQTVTESCNVQNCPGPLAGLRHIGCYFVPRSSTSLRLLENETPDLSDNPITRTKAVDKCGLGALQFNYKAFSVVLGFCISGSNLTSQYVTFPGTFCRNGRGGNFFNLLYMDVYSIDDTRSYAIAANQVVHSTTIAFPTPTPTATATPTTTPTNTSPPGTGGLGNPNSSFKFLPSLVLLIVVAVFSLVILY